MSDFLNEKDSCCDWEDEETKFFVRSKLLMPNELDALREQFKDYDFEADVAAAKKLAEDEPLPNVRPSVLYVVKPLLGMTAIFAFYLAMWLH